MNLLDRLLRTRLIFFLHEHIDCRFPVFGLGLSAVLHLHRTGTFRRKGQMRTRVVPLLFQCKVFAAHLPQFISDGLYLFLDHVV